MLTTPRRRAHAALLVAALIYSGYNVLLAQALAQLSPVAFSLCRELAAIPLTYVWAARLEGSVRLPSTKHERARLVVLGLVLGGYQLCFATGVALTSATTAGIFQAVEPTTAAILGAALGNEPMTRRRAAAALLAGGGVLLLEVGGGVRPNILGCALLFCQGVGIATYCLLQRTLVRGGDASDEPPLLDDHETTPRRSRDEPWGPITVTAHALPVAASVLAVAAVLDTLLGIEKPFGAAQRRRLSRPDALAALAYATILSSTVGYSLRAYANRFLDSATLVLYNAVQPPLTALLAVCFGLGGFGWREAGATALVGAAVFVASRETKTRKPFGPSRHVSVAGAASEAPATSKEVL